MGLPLSPPIEPMLAKAGGSTLPDGDGLIFEPKWDGFRCLVFRDGADVVLQSRNGKAIERYVPELLVPLRARLPERCVVDGELIVVRDGRLDFDALQARIHPAASRIERLSTETPTSYVAFDLLALGDRDLTTAPLVERRALLEETLGNSQAPVHLTPATTDRDTASDWFARFEGAGLDGLIAKPPDGAYQPGKRSLIKVKHRRTADCVVAGVRAHKDGGVGSLLLGVYDRHGQLRHLGAASGFRAAQRHELVGQLASLHLPEGEHGGHPWLSAPTDSPDGADGADGADDDGDDDRDRDAVRGREGAGTGAMGTAHGPGGPSRWDQGRDRSWVPLRPDRVVEVAYEGFGAGRFRHPARFVRWRPDRTPTSCTEEQFATSEPLAVDEVLGA